MQSEMNLLNHLLERSNHDLGIVTFMRNVFLINYRELKNYQLVCRTWRLFISDHVWRHSATRQYLRRRLKENILNSSYHLREVKLDLNVCEGRNDCFSLKSSDDVVLLDVSDIDSAELCLVNLHNLSKKLIKLGGFDVTGGEQLISEIGGSCFYTAFSHRHNLLIWDHDGILKNEFSIQNEGSDIRIRSMKSYKRNKLLFILCLERVILLKHDEDDQLSVMRMLNFNLNEGTVRAVIQRHGWSDDNILSAHDHVVNVWDVSQQTSPLATLTTGFVKDMIVKNDVLVTVGSLQKLGLHFWDVKTGSLLKTLFSNFIFFEILEWQDHVLVKGNNTLKGLIDFDKQKIISDFHSRDQYLRPHENMVITTTKEISFDISSDCLIVKDFFINVLE